MTQQLFTIFFLTHLFLTQNPFVQEAQIPFVPMSQISRAPLYQSSIVPLTPVALTHRRYEVMLLVCWDKNTPPPRPIDPEILVPDVSRWRCVLCQGGQEHSDSDSYLEHEGPDDNAEVFVHDRDTFRAAALIRRPLASSRYGAEGLCL